MSATSDTNNTSLTEDLTDEPLQTTNNQIDNTHDTQNKEINECNQVNTNLLNKKEDNNIEPKYNKSNEVTITKDTTKIENNKKNKESNIPQTNTKKSFTDLNNNITNSNNNITLYNNYEFKNDTDTALNNAIHIYKNNFTINGNYKTIDANNTKFLFRIKGENITINNLIFKNGINLLFTNVVNLIINNATFENCINDKFSGNSAIHAIVARNSEFTINNGLFENKNDIHWSLIYASNSKLIIINTTFTNITSQYATAIYAENCESYINNSRFINLFANKTGGALAFKESNNVTIENCEFINVSSNKNGGAIFSDINGIEGKGQGLILIDNTLFSNCSSGFGGACLQLGGHLLISYSNFTSNYADFNGGAIYTSSADSMVENCIFKDNHLGIYEGYPTYGGAIFCDYGDLYLYDSEFINNSAYQGSGVYSYDSYYELLNLTFTNNSNPAIYTFFDEEHSTKEDIKGITLNLTDFNNTYYPGVLCGEGMKIVLVNNTINITDIPTYYDLRELNLTSPIRNQGYMGACWAFGMTAALESALIKALNYTNPDFSENNMQNTMLIYSQYGSSILIEGGNNILSIAYLLSWFGAFSQDYDSYDELGKISPIIRTDEDIHVQDIILISNTPLTKTNNDINRLNNVKETILKYGALCGNLYLNDNFYNRNTYGYYTPNRLGINHAICVVGWDDNYPASNFLNDCPGNGAWIVKNSYGSKWGDEGYFYVSYYDQTLSPSNRGFCFVAIALENTIQYNKNYQYDLSGLDFFDESYQKYSNKFESVEDDVIAAVGTYFNKESVDYTVEIIVNDISVYTQTGVSPYNGYHTIKLDKYIPIKKGDIFSIKITSNAVPISIRTRVHFENGTSFKYEPNSEKWEDLSKNKYVACIKAYTLPQLIKTENLKIINGDELFIVDVNETNANVIVSINNNILSEITDENGIAKFKLPELKNGNYTITTTYNQTNILNTIEVNIDLYKIIKEQNQTINTLNETINELNNLTQTQNQTINTLNETTKEQSQKLNKTNEDLKNTKTQIKTLNNEINTLKKQIENLKQQQKTTKTTTKIIAKPKTYKTKTKVKKYTITLKSGNKKYKASKKTVKIIVK